MNKFSFSLLFVLIIALVSCNSNAQDKAKVTFIELGSVRCIPCQKMQIVIKQVEEKYPKDVAVIFYDVWTDEGKPFGEQYKIDLIPTQVFLDQNGKEYFRHEGFFEFEELEKVLLQKLKLQE